jgi:Pyridoxamine 5'-phosphate oxidase
MTFDSTGLRILTRAECLHRLATVSVGRVALSWRAMPLILPVHFRVFDDTVVLSTACGTTLDRATDDTVVAFEAEGPAGAAEPVWSVVAHGMATHRDDSLVVDRGQVRCIEIDVTEVTGRELLDPTDPMAPPVLVALPRW